jgi:hypothetical protein
LLANAFRQQAGSYGSNETPKIAGLVLVAIVMIASNSIPSNANASELGRLFYTPQQRAQLEAQQASGATVEGVKRNFIIVNGVIQKQGGNRIVWLNGVAQTPVRSNDNPASIDIAVPGQQKHTQVKVGQRLILDTPTASTPDSKTPAPATDINQ